MPILVRTFRDMDVPDFSGVPDFLQICVEDAPSLTILNLWENPEAKGSSEALGAAKFGAFAMPVVEAIGTGWAIGWAKSLSWKRVMRRSVHPPYFKEKFHGLTTVSTAGCEVCKAFTMCWKRGLF